jgi:hypothetical protein
MVSENGATDHVPASTISGAQSNTKRRVERMAEVDDGMMRATTDQRERENGATAAERSVRVKGAERHSR